MPTLPPGTANNVNLSFTPTWLFTPTTSAANNVVLTNNGQNTVYVGQADVTVNTGLPILPGSKPVKLTNVTSSLYAISTVSLGTLVGTVFTAGTAGATVLNFTTQATNYLTVSNYVVVGNKTITGNQEALSVERGGGDHLDPGHREHHDGVLSPDYGCGLSRAPHLRADLRPGRRRLIRSGRQ